MRIDVVGIGLIVKNLNSCIAVVVINLEVACIIPSYGLCEWEENNNGQVEIEFADQERRQEQEMPVVFASNIPPTCVT